ncbi:MAG: hypothetical protein AAGN35_26435 [Bacteroidota bacterium]
MDLQSASQLTRLAPEFAAKEHHLAAAILLGEATLAGVNNAGTWYVFGVELFRSAGVLVRKPFFEWSARCLKRAVALVQDPELEELATEGLMDLSSQVNVDSLTAIEDDELESLLAFLDIDINTFPKAISALPEDQRGYALMVMGDHGSPRFLPVMLSALRGVWGDYPARVALKRLGNFGDTPEIRETLEVIVFSPRSRDYQPYLRMAMERIDPEWAMDLLYEAEQAREENDPDYPEDYGGNRPWWRFWNR